MAAKCFPLVGGRVMRVTRLDGCGRPDLSHQGCAQVTSDGFVSIEVTANVEDGDTISVTNAAGKVCVSQVPCPTLTGYSVNITFCDVDPELFAMVTGQDSVLDPATGEGIGFRVNSGKSGCDQGFALEVWSSVPGVSCPVDSQGNPIPGASGASGYILFPFLQGGVFGDFTIENDAVSFTMQGAGSKDGSGWGVGPYDVTLDAAGTPGPLTDRIDPKDHMHVQIAYVEPPKPSCGCGPIPARLNGPVATQAFAGLPGYFGPSGAKVPANAAALSSVGADPRTAWTDGAYIATADGAKHHWDGSAWSDNAAAIVYTGVKAGQPGSFQPVTAPPPADLTALQSDAKIGDTGTSKPGSTPWTVGQYVLLADNSLAHWDGTGWHSGAAPA